MCDHMRLRRPASISLCSVDDVEGDDAPLKKMKVREDRHLIKLKHFLGAQLQPEADY